MLLVKVLVVTHGADGTVVPVALRAPGAMVEGQSSV